MVDGATRDVDDRRDSAGQDESQRSQDLASPGDAGRRVGQIGEEVEDDVHGDAQPWRTGVGDWDDIAGTVNHGHQLAEASGVEQMRPLRSHPMGDRGSTTMIAKVPCCSPAMTASVEGRRRQATRRRPDPDSLHRGNEFRRHGRDDRDVVLGDHLDASGLDHRPGRGPRRPGEMPVAFRSAVKNRSPPLRTPVRSARNAAGIPAA